MDTVYILILLGIAGVALMIFGWITSTRTEKRRAIHARQSARHLLDADNPHQGDLEEIIRDLSKATDEDARHFVQKLTEKLEGLRKQKDS